MARSRTLKWLTLVLALLWLQLPEGFAQGGPSVQIFTSTLPGGGTRVMPLERLPLQVSFSANAGYDTNVDTNPSDGQGSFFSDATVNLSYSFGTERTRASASTSLSVTYYDSPGRQGFNFNPDLALNLGVSHAVSERLSLTLSVFVRYGSEPDFSNDLGTNRRVGNYFETADSISASYQWLERFSTVTRYSFATIQYGNETASMLPNILDQGQNRVEHGFGQQSRFLFLPFTTITADYIFSSVTYDLAFRNSTSHFLLAGIDQTFGPHLQANFRAGAQFRHTNQKDTINPSFDGSLNWVVGEKTSLNFTARYLTEEPDLLGSTSQTTFRAGVAATYALTGRITSTLSLYYVHDQNNPRFDLPVVLQPNSSEDSIDVGLNLAYAVNTRLSVTVGYHFTEVLSDLEIQSYTRSSFSGGLSYSF